MNASRRIPRRSTDCRRLAALILLAAIPIALNSSIQVKRPAPSIVNLHKVDRAVSDDFRRGHTSFRVLVRTRSDAAGRVMARLNARSISARLVSTASRVVAISADRRTLASLVVDPDVERISDDAVVQSSGVTWTSTTPTTPKDNRVMRTLGMDYWVPDGKGVVVAVIDSGVVANSDLQSAASYDFMSGAPKSVAGGDLHFDSYGHGSHVASLIANVGASSDKVYAVSPAGRRLWRSRCSTQMEPATPATLLQQSTSALRTDTSSRSTSSIFRWATRSANLRPRIRSCRR